MRKQPIRRVLKTGKALLKAFIELFSEGTDTFKLRIHAVSLDIRDMLFPGYYDRWISSFEPDSADLTRQKIMSEKMEYRPLFSFITPVYDPPVHIFEKLVQSILDQSYSKWEMCIVNGGDSLAVAALIDSLQNKDSRIRAEHIKNLGISGNSNAAISFAKGEYLVLVDHDDIISPALLFEAAKKLNEEPSLDIIYYDEDKITEEGRQLYPYFKPRRLIERRILTENYLAHCVICRQLVLNAGGFDPDMDGAQDWDLILRCIERTNRIAHIPRVLYHWRMIPGSASVAMSEKPYARDRQRAARNRYLERIRKTGEEIHRNSD